MKNINGKPNDSKKRITLKEARKLALDILKDTERTRKSSQHPRGIKPSPIMGL